MNLPRFILILVTTVVLSSLSVSGRSLPVNSSDFQSSEEPEGELQFLQYILRHGDRTPYWFYKNDRYQEKDFWEGEGQLVNKGKERMYRLGETLRKRYFDYVENIRIQNINGQSSPIRRCLETNQALLAGLFPPRNHSVWSSGQLPHFWQPIAVNTVEESRSWKLNPDAPCPTASKLEKDMETNVPELKKFLADNHDFMQKVGLHAGEDFFNHYNWLWVGYLYDTLWTEANILGSRYVAPDWLTQVGNDTLARLSKFNDMVFDIYGQAPAFVKLRSGTFLKEVIQNMRNVAKGNFAQMSAENKKLTSYTSHDTFIAYVMHALGLYRGQPGYGSGILFELRKSAATGVYNVHLFYSNTTNNYDIYRLKLNESPRFKDRCQQTYCTLDAFADSLAAYLEDNAEKDCKLS